jgi:dienelactone hydrolase
MARGAWLLVLIATVTYGCAHARVDFSNATPGRPLSVPATLYWPVGGGPFPAVVLMHGCEGVSDNSRRWARWLTDRGYLALVVDSWTPRGLRETCSFEVEDPPSTERLDDAIGALHYLHARGDVDRHRIAVMGWSNGGVFALAVVNGPTLARAARRGVVPPSPGYAASVAIYPGGCESLKWELVIRPTVVIIGDADDWVSPWSCARMVDLMRAKGADISILQLPGAYHYFDFVGQEKTVLPHVGNDTKAEGCCGATVAYDAPANAAAHRRVEDFLGYYLKTR